MPDVLVVIVPEPTGLDAIARQIKVTGRAYPIFDIGRLIVKAPDRFQADFQVKRNKDGSVAQRLYTCDLDNTLWLSEADAGRHALAKFFDTFYQTEKIPTDPPKGTYTFVAQCGMSGVILGPPNYHDYQQKLVKLHQERFSKLPFDTFKSRVKIVREEETVKQWIDEQSFKTEYTALNLPEELKFDTRAAVEKHFRETHQANVVKEVQSQRVSAKDAVSTGDPNLRRLYRHVFEDQRRFPLKVVNVLCEEFAKHGLQFFKKDKTVTHVAVSRPHFLDLDVTPVSDSIRSIIKFVNETEKCTRRKIFDALAPVAVAPTPVAAKEAAAPAPAESAPAPAAESSEAPATEQPAGDAPAAEQAAEKPAAAAPEPEQSPEHKALNADLHWLIHQGHVIEFSNGSVETAKKPRPTPPQGPGKKKKKKQQQQQRRAAAVCVVPDCAPILI